MWIKNRLITWIVTDILDYFDILLYFYVVTYNHSRGYVPIYLIYIIIMCGLLSLTSL